jgi:hypothetical protein
MFRSARMIMLLLIKNGGDIVLVNGRKVVPPAENHNVLRRILGKSPFLIGGLVVLVVVVVTTIFAGASGQFILFEAEDSNTKGLATVSQREDASGGEVLKFGNATVPETPVPPAPTPPPTVITNGVWISKAELMALPTSGPGWDNVKGAATSSLGSVNLGDNNSTHDTNVLALSYYAVRTDDSQLINTVASEIDTVKNSSRERALPFCRNITSYVIAADVINLSQVNPSVDKNFRDFIRKWVFEDTSLTGHSGDGIKQTASNSANNWGTMCRAAYAATAAYLGDNSALKSVTLWQKGFLGDTDSYDGYSYKSTNWHADPSNKVGINPKGATRNGNNIDGVLPEDQRRTGEFTWPAPKGSYPWEGMQGAIVADYILQRRGLISNNYQDSAMVRAYNWLYFINNNPPSGDDTFQPWLANKIYGTKYKTSSSSNPGKNMGWTDWTHQ